MHARLLAGLRRSRRLPATERSTTLAVASLVPLVSISLKLLGFPRTLRWVESTAEGPPIAIVVVHAGQVIADRATVAQTYDARFVSPAGRLSFRGNDPAEPYLGSFDLR